jgi:tetratricopeptide (TPR) repeat protein
MSDRNKICLNMIVKNESQIIETLVDSVAPHIACYVVCDTGSTDNTIAKLQKRFTHWGVEGEIHSVPFVHFSQARNEALEHGRASRFDFDYFLLADADMELVVQDPSFVEGLHEPAYIVKQESGSFGYYNTRLMRRDVQAKYVGATHEYLDAPAVTQLAQIRFIDHANGANRVDKIERDTAFLLASLQEDPDDPRALFYLAQTCRDAKKWREAAAWYELRTKAGGFAEESWYARYQMALCFEHVGDQKRFVSESLKAFEERPWRAEPLHALARHYRENGMMELAHLFAEKAASIPFPANDLLFIDLHIYRSAVHEELTIAGLQSDKGPKQESSRRSCSKLTTSRESPWGVVDWARRHYLSYVQSAEELFGGVERTELVIEARKPYRLSNPSVAAAGGKLSCIVRSVNYLYQDGYYVSQDEDRVIRTENYYVELANDLSVTTSVPIHDNDLEREFFPFRIRGYEDCRLIFLRDRWWCSATIWDGDSSGLGQIALLRLDSERQIDSVKILHSPAGNCHEKNWVPLVRDDELFFIYWSDPLTILNCNPDTGKLEKVSEILPSLLLKHQRGGSQAIPIEDGWLYVTHEVIQIDQLRRNYLHRFIHLDKKLNVQGITDPFYFDAPGIEFCAGMAVHPQSGRLLVSYGQTECSAVIASMRLPKVLNQLRLN